MIGAPIVSLLFFLCAAEASFYLQNTGHMTDKSDLVNHPELMAVKVIL